MDVCVFDPCEGGNSSPPDASGPPIQSNYAWCSATTITVRCAGSEASVTKTYAGRGAGSHSVCKAPPDRVVHTCASGCSITTNFDVGYEFGREAPDVQRLFEHPEVMCAEAPAATVGAACPCLPTRATIAADGTVSGQDYLACAGTCVATQTFASGRTIACAGDWECPAGALCDDTVPALSGTQTAVCKPGPRGTLTPTMLSGS